MGTPINPVLSGLLGGFQLAHQIKGERMAQEAHARLQRRDEENAQVRDLQTQLGLAKRGYRPSTPDQEAEIASGATMGPAGLMPSDIKTRMANYSGQTYVREPEEVRAQKALDLRLKEATALGDVNTQAAVKRAKGMLDATGFEVDDAMASALHLKKGQKFPAEKVDDLMRAFSNEEAARRAGTPHPVGTGRITIDDSGNQTMVNTMSNGTATETPLNAKGKTAGRRAGSITDYQGVQIKRQQAADAAKAEAESVKAQTAAQKEIDTLNKQEQLLHAENREIGQRLLAGSAGTATNKKGQKTKVTEQDAAALKVRLADNQTKVKALQDRQHGIIMKFAGGGGQPANDPAGLR